MGELLGASQLRSTCGGVPVPVRLISAVPLVEELLWMLSCPVAAPAVVGSNPTSSVTARPGFRVTGNVAPDTVKPVPVTVAALTVTASVPVELSVRVCVEAVLTGTLPNATLAGLMLNVWATTAFNRRAKLVETPPALAGTVTVAGTVTAALLLARLTLRPPLAAAAVNVTVQLSLPDPVMDALLQVSPLSAPGAGLETAAEKVTICMTQ